MKTGKKQPDHVTYSTLSKPKYIENTNMMGVVCNFISTPIYFQCLGLQNWRGGGACEVLPLRKGGAEKAMLKGGHNKFWGSFYAVA